MPDGAILGIHSNVTGGDLTGGHAWLTITRNGRTTYYGLWPDAHPRTVDNGDGSDIRTNLERRSEAAASRYYRLTEAMARRFDAQVGANVHWFYTNNCSSWASEVVLTVVGEDVDADDAFGFESPRELGQSIQALEARDPTSPATPRRLEDEPATSIVSSGRGTSTSSRQSSVGR